MTTPKLNIFIIHPSHVLSDHTAHGDGLLSYRYICELAARGHQLSVACETLELLYPVPDNVALYPIKLSAPLDFARRVEYAWKMRKLFARLHRVQPFDIAHQLNPVFRGLSLGLAFVPIPIILGPYVDYWGLLRPTGVKAFLLDSLSRVQQMGADAVIISGEAARSRIIAKHHLARSTYTIPYGIDLDAFAQQPFPSGDPVIVFLGGLARRKGIFVLLKAFETLARRVPNVQLLIAGGGEMDAKVRKSAAQSAYAERIRCIGYVARDGVPALLAQATLLCAPSFGEPYGMNIVEAMAVGRAVVASNAGGPVGLISAEGGILVPPGNAPALAAALEEIITTPALGQKMGAFNRRAAEAYAWPVVIDQLEAAYLKVRSDPAQTTAARRQLRSTNS